MLLNYLFFYNTPNLEWSLKSYTEKLYNFAIENNNKEAIDYAIKNKIRPDEKTFEMALEMDNKELVKYCIDNSEYFSGLNDEYVISRLARK